MLRKYFVQQWFNLSDPGAEELLYESAPVRRFVGVDLGIAAAPDETTILRFRHMLEKLRQGHVKEADALFQQVTERERGYLDASLGRAQIAVSGRKLDEADRMITAVLKRQDNLPEAHNMKGLVLLLRKDRQGARREFSRAIELRPQYITPRLYLAVLARLSGDYPTAAAEYKALTVVAPRLPAGYLGQAEALMLQGREADGIRILEGWKAADPGSLLPYQVLANVDLSDRKPQEAIRQL